MSAFVNTRGQIALDLPDPHRPYRVAIDEQADGVAREFTMYEGEVGRCSCGAIFFTRDAAAEHDCSFDDSEIVPESCDADDDDSFPDTLTGGIDADVEDIRSDAAVERRLTRCEE